MIKNQYHQTLTAVFILIQNAVFIVLVANLHCNISDPKMEYCTNINCER